MPKTFALFDFDKTLTDQKQSVYYQTWRLTVEVFLKRKATESEYEVIISHLAGSSWNKAALDLLMHFRLPVSYSDFLYMLSHNFLRNVARGDVFVRPDALEFFQFAERNNFSLGICSNAPSSYLNRALILLGLYHRAEVVLSSDGMFDGYVNDVAIPEIEKFKLSGECDWRDLGRKLDRQYMKPGKLPWQHLCSRLKVGRRDRIFIFEDRVRHAVGAVQGLPGAKAFVIEHYDNRSERIPKKYFPSRIRWIKKITDAIPQVA